MAPKKKATSFMEFAIEWKSKDIRRKSLSMKKVQELAGKIWIKMTDEEKLIYKKRAVIKGPLLSTQGNKIPVPAGKSTSSCLPEIMNYERSADITKRIMKKEIEDLVKSSRINNNFKHQKYYFIMANYFVKATGSDDTINYFPAEIALTEFSLEQGVLNKFHSFINPGDVLFGKVYQAQVYSEETHSLPLPPNAKGEKDLGKLYIEIMKFLSPETEGENFQPPLLFTTAEYVPIIPKIMSFLYQECYETRVPVPKTLQILPMEYLFYTLKMHSSEIGELKPPKSKYITDKILETDKYDYQDGIACDFHEELDRSKYCALSYCIRWAYTFAENLCLDVAIYLKPGLHIPSDDLNYDNDLKVERVFKN